MFTLKDPKIYHLSCKAFVSCDNKEKSYPQWQSLPHGDVPGGEAQEQKIPSSSRRLLILFVRYMS